IRQRRRRMRPRSERRFLRRGGVAVVGGFAETGADGGSTGAGAGAGAGAGSTAGRCSLTGFSTTTGVSATGGGSSPRKRSTSSSRSASRCPAAFSGSIWRACRASTYAPRSSPRSSVTRASPTIAIELRGSSSAAWRYRRSARSSCPTVSARSASRINSIIGSRSHVVRDARSRQQQERRPVVERRVHDHLLEQLVEDPPELRSLAQAELLDEVAAIDLELAPVEDELAFELPSDALAQCVEPARVRCDPTAEVVRFAQREQVVDRLDT